MKIYLVGGAVRDTLLHYPFTEKDWVIVGSSPEEIIKYGYTPVGKDFPVFLHPTSKEEYALARTERKIASGYKGFVFHADPSITLEEDLKRRDLTINAMAMDTDGTLIDPYDGQQDIAQKQLRHVSTSFSEDPVRILRVARLMARYHHLGFTVAEETMQLMQSMVVAGETQHLVAERVWQECQKALAEQDPHIFFEILQQCHALKDVMRIDDANTVESANQYLYTAKNHHTSSLIRYAAWCYAMTLENIHTLCKHLAVPTAYRELALFTKQHFTTIANYEDWTAENLSILFTNTDALRKPERFDNLLQTCECIHTNGDRNFFAHKEQLQEALGAIHNVDVTALMERGYQGKALGEAIQTARKDKLEKWLLHEKSRRQLQH